MQLARKRRLEQNPPLKGVKRGENKEKGILRISQPVNCVSNSKFLCRTCREELATKKSSIESHSQSQKHMNGKKKLALKNREESNILKALKAYESQVHSVGDGLPYSTRVCRAKLVTTMLKAGVPLGKIDLFRYLLEEHAYALTSSTHLRQLPFIVQDELSRIKREILKRPLSIIFYGTTHICEAFVLVLRYLTDDWELKQCVG